MPAYSALLGHRLHQLSSSQDINIHVKPRALRCDSDPTPQACRFTLPQGLKDWGYCHASHLPLVTQTKPGFPNRVE